MFEQQHILKKIEQWADRLPYTLPQLRVILESLCGAGNYSADVAD